MSMDPTADQRASLSRMEAVLGANRKATLLARSLWEFFRFRVACTIVQDDKRPNRHWVEGIVSPTVLGEITVKIEVRKKERRAGGLVQGLLHANLIAEGSPRFWLEDRGDPRGAGIGNTAD